MIDVNRRQFLGAVGAGAAGWLAGCTGDGETSPTATRTETPQKMLRNDSFEDGLTGWTVGRDLPTDPNADGDRPVTSSVSVTDHLASDGDRSCALSIDGRQDDGTLWVQQNVDLGGYDRLAVDLYSRQESFNVIAKVAAYTGPVPESGLLERDFDTTEAVEDHAGWKTYEYDITHEGTGLAAVGISVVWETELTRYLDDVRLR